MVDIPPGAAAILSLPQGVTGDHVTVKVDEVLAVVAFTLRQFSNLIPAEAGTFYSVITACGIAPHFNASLIISTLNCVRAFLEPVGLKALAKKAESLLLFGDGLLTLKDTVAVNVGGDLGLQLSYRNPPDAPPDLPGGAGGQPDGTISGICPVNGPALWRLGTGPNLDTRGQPYLVVGDTASGTLDENRRRCLSRHYVLRDFYLGNVLDVWTQESVLDALCPAEAPELDLPAGSTNWILREESGAAWFVNGASQLQRIVDGGQYIACAQRHLVLDYALSAMVERFGERASAARASCG